MFCTQTTDADSRARSNSFHFSAKHGFTEVVTRMMAMGFTKLLSDDSKSPVEVAVEEKHYDTAEVLLRRMDKKRLVHWEYIYDLYYYIHAHSKKVFAISTNCSLFELYMSEHNTCMDTANWSDGMSVSGQLSRM